MTRYDSLTDALAGTTAPQEIVSKLVLIEVPHIDFEGQSQTGQLVIHQELADEVQDIFAYLYKERFPIQKIVPIAAYGWDDELSMAGNNTSAFNYRTIIGTDRLSNHSQGRAIDINPLLNPYFAYDGKVYPQDATYQKDIPGTITPESAAVRCFKKQGWTWLGDRESNADYQHFEK